MMKKILFLCLLAFWGEMTSLYASHFMGTEMSYQYLGGCDYRLYYTLYIDCKGAATQSYLPPSLNNPYPAPTITFTGTGCVLPAINATWFLYDAADVTPLCPGTITSCSGNNQVGPSGTAAYRYYADVSFCGVTCSAVTASWGSCCRDYAITSGASGAGMYTEITIPLTYNNSSPRFIAPPIVFLPAGQMSIIQQQAYDEDGDSLVYSFASCFQDSATPVPYNAGFSPTAPVGAAWSCSINPQTGELTFNPTAGGVAVGVMCIQVAEYRNGILLGTISRDAAIYMQNVPMGVNIAPAATMTNVSGVGLQNPPFHLKTEVGSLLSFDLTVTDPDPGQLLAYTNNVTNLFPGATLTASGNTSPMTLTFSWTPPNNSYKGQNLPLFLDIFDDLCPINGHLYAFSNIEIDSNYIAAIITPSDCVTPTGAIDVSVGGGSLPYTYSWSNGATTQDLTNVLGGMYALTITDANGTVWDSIFYVNSLGLSSVINSYPPDCNTANGSLKIIASGGTAPYTYTWSNAVIGDSLSNLLIGGYSVDAYDALGCYYHTVTMLNYDPADSCFSRIEGTLYYDFNNNCLKDPLEVGIANVWIDINPGGAIFTDANGYYSIIVNDTGTFQVFPIFSNSGGVANNCLPANLTLTPYISTLGIDSLLNDFPMVYQPDISVFHTEGGYVPGFNHTMFISCHNLSYYTANATLTYQYDAIMHNPLFSIPPTTLDTTTRIATWNLSNFVPSTVVTIYGTSVVEMAAMIGDTTKTYTYIVPLIGDADPSNNQDTCNRIVGGSYDPNYKEVSPTGQTQYGLIPPSTNDLEYTIHFQNVGNYQATFVIIRDTIDVSHLDITTTEIQATSHNCITSIEQDSILVFTFNNINLPDSASNPAGSQGFVKYRIKLKPNLPLYSAMDNTAAIYFDFNKPVITNTVTSTLYNAMNLSVTTNTNICPGDSILAVVTDGRQPYQFDWSNGTQNSNNLSGNIQIPANFTSGLQSLQVSDYYGAVVSQNFLLNVYATANATFSYNPAGNTYYFTPNSFNNVTYNWDFGNGQTSNTPSATATYTQSGIYTITLIATDMCGGEDTSTQTITLSVANEPSFFQQQTQLSPNPTKDKIQLSFPNEKQQSYTLTIFDIHGKAVKTVANIKANQLIISINDLASSVYFWELKGAERASGVLLVE